MALTSWQALPGVLDVEPRGAGRWRGATPDVHRPRVFGGHLAAQALLVAARSVPTHRAPHSLHAYFLRAATGNSSVDYDVVRLREGRSFSSRSVTAVQDGEPVFSLLASFHDHERGLDHQLTCETGPPPADEPSSADGSDLRHERWRRLFPGWELRQPAADAHDGTPQKPTQVWLRSRERLGDDPLLHAVALTYASDMTLIETTVRAHDLPFVRHGLRLVSLDHSLWFHRPCRADEWLLFESVSPTTAGARGLATGHVFASDGRLVATVVQEGLLRRPAGPPPQP